MVKNTTTLPRHVLVIEDDDDVAYLIEALLVREGFEVALKRDGREALNAIRSELPADIVVCDLMLPHVDGFQLISEVRATPGWEQIPIVVLSSMNMEKHIVKALEAGANEYITKPFRPAEFVARLRRHLPDKIDGANVETIPPVDPIKPTPTTEDLPLAEVTHGAAFSPIVVTKTSSADTEPETDDVEPNELKLPQQYLAMARAQMGPLVMAVAGISIVAIAFLAGPETATTENMTATAKVHHAQPAGPSIVSPTASPAEQHEASEPADAMQTPAKPHLHDHGHHDQATSAPATESAS